MFESLLKYGQIIYFVKAYSLVLLQPNFFYELHPIIHMHAWRHFPYIRIFIPVFSYYVHKSMFDAVCRLNMEPHSLINYELHSLI